MADEIRVTFSGLSDALAAIDRIKIQLDQATQRAVSQAGQLLVKTARGNFIGSHAPGMPHVGGPFPNVVSGDLKRSIRSQSVQKIGAGRYSVTVGPTIVYARIIELGGTITPKNASILSWMTPRDRVFAKKVTIPPYPYFRPAYVTTLSRMNDIFEAAWKRALSNGE